MNLTSDDLVSQKVLVGFSPGRTKGIAKGTLNFTGVQNIKITKWLAYYPLKSLDMNYLWKISTVHNLGKNYIVRHTYIVRNPSRLSVGFLVLPCLRYLNFVIFFFTSKYPS